MSANRIHWIDNLKGFAILLVVLGHCLQEGILNYNQNILFRFIYSFHMPLFFIISGYLSYKIDLKFWSITGKRAYQLLIPYFVFCKWEIRDDNFIAGIDSVFDVGNNLWFLWTLFFINVTVLAVVLLVRKLYDKKLFVAICLITYSLFIYCSALFFEDNIFGIKLYCKYVHCFVFGWIVRMFEIDKKISPLYLIVCIPLFASSFVIQYLIICEGIQVNKLVVELIGVVVAYSGSLTFSLLFNWLLPRTTFLYAFALASLGIYCIHFIYIGFFSSILPIPFVFILSASLSLVSVYLIRKTIILKPIIGEHIDKYGL